MEEYANDRGNCSLLAQFFCTSGGEVRYVGAQAIKVCYHIIERATHTNRFLFSQFLIRYAIFSVQFAPCSFNHNVFKCGSYPREIAFCEIERRLHAHCLETCGITPPYPPNLANRKDFQCLNTFLVVVD